MTEVTTKADNSPEALFRAKITERIRSDIGELMPDEMLRSVVTDAINAELYRDTRPSSQSWGKPQPWVQIAVEKAISKSLSEFVQKELEERDDELRQMFAEHLKDALPQLLSHLLIEAMKANNFNMADAVGRALNE